LSRAGRALGNLAGGVETNRANVIQIELVGTADKRLAERWGAPSLYVEQWPAKYLAGIAAWMRWVEANFAVPPRCTVRFLKYPASAGADNPNRLGSSDWVRYAGWLGHQHVPEQARGHGDPGLIDIAALLAGAEDLSIVDEKTQRYLDEQFESIGKRVDRAVQRVGGRSNSVYSDSADDFKDLVMAKEALAEARAAKEAAQKASDGVAQIKSHLGVR
jgi:hypothetical protein